MKTIGDRLIFLRENLDYTQVKLAKMVTIAKASLYKYERNLCEPRAEIIARLADALNTTADFIVGRTNDYSPLSKDKDFENSKNQENELIQKFRLLSSEDKAKIEERIEILLENQN